MPSFYLDTSAAVKLYIVEVGSRWLQALTAPAPTTILYTSRVAGPELIAALFRKARTGGINQADAIQAGAVVRADWEARFQIVEVTTDLAHNAIDLAERNGLRGFDSVHLAAALVMRDSYQTRSLPAPLFLSADLGQLQAALREGLQAEDPNSHP